MNTRRILSLFTYTYVITENNSEEVTYKEIYG